MLNIEDLTQSLIMIQPILYSYSFHGPPEVRKLAMNLFHVLNLPIMNISLVAIQIEGITFNYKLLVLDVFFLIVNLSF